MKRDFWGNCPICSVRFRGDSPEMLSLIMDQHIKDSHPEEGEKGRKDLGGEPTKEKGSLLLPVIYEASRGELAPREMAERAIAFAQAVGLKPELGHICLYFGRPWVTIDGWYYRFRKRFPKGVVKSRPLSPQERMELGLEDNLHAYRAEVYEEDGGKLLALGFGYAREGDEPLAKGSAVETRWPWSLALKRAEEDALRRAVPLDFEGRRDEPGQFIPPC